PTGTAPNPPPSAPLELDPDDDPRQVRAAGHLDRGSVCNGVVVEQQDLELVFRVVPLERIAAGHARFDVVDLTEAQVFRLDRVAAVRVVAVQGHVLVDDVHPEVLRPHLPGTADGH